MERKKQVRKNFNFWQCGKVWRKAGMPSSFSVWDANTVVSRVHVSVCCLCEGCVFFGEPTQGWPQRLCRICWKGLVPSLRDCSECAAPQPCPQENSPRTSTLKVLEGHIAKLLSQRHAACTLGPTCAEYRPHVVRPWPVCPAATCLSS